MAQILMLMVTEGQFGGLTFVFLDSSALLSGT